jgi:hypothetical protein
MVYNHLVKSGKIENSPFKEKMNLAGKVSITNAYELEELKNVFQKPWDDDLSYLLNLELIRK